MASNAGKAPFLRLITKRGFSANVCPRPLGQAADIHSATLSNKIVVATADSTLPISRVSIVFRAGARNESYDVLGASHMLRIATGLSTKNSTGFAITRNIQQIGGSLTATSDRELVSYTVETTSDNIETGLRYLQDVIQPAFKPWEVADNIARIKYQVAAVPPQVRAIELLHKAAFRNGLGNSIYIPKFKIGQLSSESLLHYVATNCTGSRCAVVGVGIDHNVLSGFAQSLDLSTGNAKMEPSHYYGGDARHDTPGNLAHVAVGGPGGALSNQKEALAFAILQQAVSSGPVTKRGNVNGSLGKALASAVSGGQASFSAVNASYSDAGIFGFVVTANEDNIGKAVEALTRSLKSGSVSGDEVKRGKSLLKAAVLESYSTDSLLISEMGTQAALTRQVTGADAVINAIDDITQQEVQEAAKKVGSSKLSVGALGNLASVPYASDLA